MAVISGQYKPMPKYAKRKSLTSQSQDLVSNIDSSFILAPIERILAPAAEELFHCLPRAQIMRRMQQRKQVEKHASGDARRMLQTKRPLSQEPECSPRV
jgi:hypothetical protein